MDVATRLRVIRGDAVKYVHALAAIRSFGLDPPQQFLRYIGRTRFTATATGCQIPSTFKNLNDKSFSSFAVQLPESTNRSPKGGLEKSMPSHVPEDSTDSFLPLFMSGSCGLLKQLDAAVQKKPNLETNFSTVTVTVTTGKGVIGINWNALQKFQFF